MNNEVERLAEKLVKSIGGCQIRDEAEVQLLLPSRMLG